MTAYDKPTIAIPEAEALLRQYFGSDVTGVTPLEGGNLSAVFAFSVLADEYVIKFSDLEGSFETERFVSSLLTRQGIPFPSCVGQGKYEALNYIISEKISGTVLGNASPEEQSRLLPEVIALLSRMSRVDTSQTRGYGWIDREGNGTHSSWKEHVIAVNAEDQTGTFWEGWYDLFRTSCLEKDVFDECYNRLLTFSAYNEPHRHFIHGDFHQYNILTDGQRITGIIDTNGQYGDYLVDLATLDWHLSKLEVIRQYRDDQERLGMSIPDFEERLIGAKYYNGLIGLRFYAKMGWKDAYYGLREHLLQLTH